MKDGEKLMETVVEVGAQRQLFIDDRIIGSLSNLKLVLNKPQKHISNPIIESDKPWEKRSILASSVMYDPEERTFKMWYRALVEGEKLVAYATSNDGVSWEKPSLGIIEYAGSKDNNILFAVPAGGMTVLKDDRDADPKRRYKMLYTSEGSVNVAFSSDGVHWTPYEKNPVIPIPSDTGNCVLWDEAKKRYVAYIRMWEVASTPSGIRRVEARAESPDFMTWSMSPPQVVATVDTDDEPSDEVYGLSTQIYEGVYIGFLWVYHRVGRNNGTIDIQLVSSRDSVHWNRLKERTPFLPLDRDSDWDSKRVVTADHFVMVGDRVFIYYSGTASEHGTGAFPFCIGLATIRRDGYISVDADENEGVLTTKPIRFKGSKLHLNVDAHEGSVRVEICGSDRKPITGFSREECVAICRNSVDIDVPWKNRSNVESLVGQNVVLRFHLRNAKIYSFWFSQ